MSKKAIIIILSTLLVLTYVFLAMWFDDEVKQWVNGRVNTFEQKHETPNVTILKDFANIKGLDRKRTIRVYTPPNYKNSSERYPVIYMNDGQRHFGKNKKDDERIDGILDKAIAEGSRPIIIVALDKSEHRNTELNPYDYRNKDINEADILLKYMVEELKPRIDKEYRTLTDSSNTAISGESLGGLFAFYALMKYPNVFSMAGSLSPSFVHSHQPFFLPKEFPNKNVKIYLSVGDREFIGNQTVMKLMEKTLLEAGFDETNLRTKMVKGGNHDSVVWLDGFRNFYDWFFNDN